MRHRDEVIARLAAAAALACASAVAGAAPAKAEQARVWDEVGRVAVKGPADVALLDEAVLHLPAGEVWVPQPQADQLMALYGNPGNHPDMPGLIVPRDPRATWVLPVRFQAAGYIRDDDARTWNADEMLRSLQVGTEEDNRERRKAGVPAMVAVGWTEPPHYDAATHRVAWALSSRVEGAPDDARALVNFNTDVLGRDGYVALNLVAPLADLPALRPIVERHLAALDFRPGKRYADFDARTDRVAPFGLASLVEGAAQPAVAKGRVAPASLVVMGVLAAALLAVGGVVVALRRRRRAR